MELISNVVEAISTIAISIFSFYVFLKGGGRELAMDTVCLLIMFLRVFYHYLTSSRRQDNQQATDSKTWVDVCCFSGYSRVGR